ncbi:hypothetical protein T08_7087 [Trichinella sp. T8]|nr:hypothetical protein T08_7087 [Trichinella sp. T8]
MIFIKIGNLKDAVVYKPKIRNTYYLENTYGLGDRTLKQLMSEMLALLDGPLTIGSKRLYTLASEATRLGHYHSVVHLPTQSISSKNLVKVNNAKDDFATTNG